MDFSSLTYRTLRQGLERIGIAPVKFNEGDKAEVFALVKSIKQERRFLLRYTEAYSIYRVVQNTAKVPGDIAEVGTFNGASAKLISEAKGADKHFFVFDSFEGLPAVIERDADHFHEGQFKSDFETVKAYLAPYEGVSVHKGFFPAANADVVEDKTFSFVHLDVDLYQPTLDSLEFFYPRMAPGGCIISHDYYASGVFQAFNEFFADRPEPLIELHEDQVLITKLAG